MTIVYVGLGVVIFTVGMQVGFFLGAYLLMLDVRDELNEYRQEFADRMEEPETLRSHHFEEEAVCPTTPPDNTITSIHRNF